ncbi:hypothetical protein CHS0354_005011 [Potamilus streckersoni]|uniref:Macro domain-containing protein n=1 Tax=Potamilus streckersoni TaxID=2493646 RepID=A0AAE0SSK7_9BIVA|nr:hypothetical protein CHS0354_005011 [Potamilus streckersoni]
MKLFGDKHLVLDVIPLQLYCVGTDLDHGSVDCSSTVNISVKFLCGRITECRVQAIVISENRKLDPSGGLAKAVLKAVGSSVWVDLKRQTGGRVQEPGAVLFTNGGALKEIKHIIHIVTPIWANYENRTGKMECLYKLQSAFLNCLKYCVDKSLTSVALPAIGTGNCGIPARLCCLVYASALIKIQDYRRLKEETNLQVYFVDISETILTSISKDFNKVFSSGYKSAADQISNEVEKDLGITCHNIREGFQVKAYKGDISLFREGSIICTVNKDLTPNGRDAEEIAQKAGAAYRQKLQVFLRTSKYKGGQVAEAVPGNLSTHLVIHCIIPSKKKWPVGREDHYSEKLISCYTNAFQTALKQRKTIVALSVLGLDSDYLNMDLCFSALKDALDTLLESSDEMTSLKQLHIICREDNVLYRIEALLSKLAK